MKTLLKYAFVGALAITLGSCEDDEQNITDFVQETVERGAVLRTINDPSDNGPLVLGSDDSSYLIQIEEQDIEGGDLLQSVDVFVRFNDLTVLSEQSITGAGADLSNPADPASDVLLRTIPAAEFMDGPFGLPRTDIVITESDLAAVLPVSDFASNDQVLIRLALNLTDGRVFSVNNAGGIITGGFFNSPFQYLMDIDSGVNINYIEENNNFFVTLDGFDNTYFVLAEITDQANGANINTLNVYRRYQDNLDDGIDNSFPEALLTSFTDADFGTSPDGFPTAEVIISPTDMVGDLDPADLNIGDAFFVRYEVITNDGRTISDEVVSGNFYDVVDVTDCPFPPIGEEALDLFVGDYALEQITPTIFGYDTFNFATGETIVTLFAEETDATQVTPGVALDPNQRAFDADYIAALGFGNTQSYVMEFNICKVTISEDAGPLSGTTGVTCTQANIILLGPTDGGSYNAEDDSEFVLIFDEDLLQDCGQGANTPQIRFIKQ
jgi:hypothetical protein